MTRDRLGRDGADPGGPELPERIVLVGFMAAGKTTVGRLLAERLGRDFVDLDEEVERAAGRPIPEIFAGEGEAGFRARERRATEAVDALGPLVVATGGGWMARPELRDRWPGAVRVWLRVGAAAAVRRLGDGVHGRPVLDPADPEGSARAILATREARYARAELAVDTEGRSPAEVAEAVLRGLRARAAAGTADAPAAGSGEPSGR